MSAGLMGGAGIDECRSLVRLWIALGVAAITAVLSWLMADSPGMDNLLAAE